jgi:glycerophosphoryl diester phosphodiesterase
MGVRLFRQIVVFSFVMHLLRSTFMYWTPKILVDLGLGNVAAAMSSAVFPLMGCIGTIFIGWYTDRFSKDGNRTGMMSLMLAGLVGCMAGIAFLIPAQGDASSTAQLGIVALLGISGFLMYGPYSLSAGAMALDLVGARAIGTCTGIIDGVGYIGGAVASWGAGVLADHAGWREVFVVLAAVSGFCAFWSWHMGRSNWPARLTVLLLVLASGCSSLEVQGHRGARGLRPENTIPAFDYALKLGVDVLELDLGVSKDEKLVIYHDQRINPVICSGSPAVPVYSLTSKKLSQIDCGSRRNPRFPEQVLTPGATIPTLDDFFEWMKHHPDRAARKVRFNIETKIEEAHPELAPPPDRFARLVVETLRRHEMVARTVLQSFDFRTLVEARKLEPRLETAILLEDRPSEDMVLIAQRIGAQMISPQHEWLTEKDVRQIHAARLKVIPWTVNAMADFERLKAIGVDGIITDYPDRLIPLARSRTTQ